MAEKCACGKVATEWCKCCDKPLCGIHCTTFDDDTYALCDGCLNSRTPWNPTEVLRALSAQEGE